MTKKIIGASLATIASLFLVFSYGLGLFGFLFPQPMANFMATLNLPRSSAMYQGMVYRRDPTPQNMYLALDRFIHAGRHDRVIQFSERFFALENYQEVLNQINQSKGQAIINDSLHITNDVARQTFLNQFYPLVANERDRLRRQYVLSLLATDDTATVVEFINYFKFQPDLQQPCTIWFFLPTSLQAQKESAFVAYALEFRARFDAEMVSSPLPSHREQLIPRHFLRLVENFLV